MFIVLVLTFAQPVPVCDLLLLLVRGTNLSASPVATRQTMNGLRVTDVAKLLATVPRPAPRRRHHPHRRRSTWH